LSRTIPAVDVANLQANS